MTIQVAAAGNAVIMRVEGRMDAESGEAFSARCDQALADGAVNIVADLSALTYISSAGIGHFVRVAKMLRQAGGEIVLTGLHGLVGDVFELTHIVSVFRIFRVAGTGAGKHVLDDGFHHRYGIHFLLQV